MPIHHYKGANKTDQRGKALEDLVEQYKLCTRYNKQWIRDSH